jgi:LPS sulfotransferase NodH
MPEMNQVKISEPRSLLSWAEGWKTLGSDVSRWLWLLESDSLCTEARRRTRLENFGDPPIEPALTVLVKSLETEADFHPLGRFFMRVHLRELLETRLRLTQTWSGPADLPETSVIEQPIFITGIPRSGSTFLHELLAEDPENRAPRVWEVMFPVPPKSERRREVDPRIRKTNASLWWFRRLAPGADSVYPIRASTPHECVAIHSYTFLSEEFVSTCHIPTYEAFLHSADLAPIYRWQKRFLQHLQLSCPNRRWVLKSPDHVYGLDKLLKVFPDATIIQIHRNPVDVLRSQIQLTKVLGGLFARPEEPKQLGKREARKIEEMVDQITRFRDTHPQLAERFIDVNYRELVSDPLAVVRRIYQQLDIQLTKLVTERIQCMALNRSRYRRRDDSSSLADLELDGAADTHRFEGYCSRFGIPLQHSE